MNDELEKLHEAWKQACARTDDPLQKDVMKLKALELAYGMNRALPELLERVKRYENLIRAMIENEPDDIVADGGHTVLNLWRHDARTALKETGQ